MSCFQQPKKKAACTSINYVRALFRVSLFSQLPCCLSNPCLIVFFQQNERKDQQRASEPLLPFKSKWIFVYISATCIFVVFFATLQLIFDFLNGREAIQGWMAYKEISITFIFYAAAAFAFYLSIICFIACSLPKESLTSCGLFQLNSSVSAHLSLSMS